MSSRTDEINKHISDQQALIDHILEAVERQRNDETVHQTLKANEVIIELERVLKEHALSLQNLADEYGARGESTVKKAITEILGVAAGLYDKVREQKVSRMLRDDYTATSLAAMGYTAFHTFGAVIGDRRIADFARYKLQDLTPVLIKISRVLPVVVAQEVGNDLGIAVDPSIVTAAVEDTHAAWMESANS